MFIAASSSCFPNLPLPEALQKLVDLEYSHVDIALGEQDRQLKPSEVMADLEKATAYCRDTHRLNISAYCIDIEATDEVSYQHFAACCRLAKATKVVSITVPSAELGTPFNEEVERLRRLVHIASAEGVRVSIRSQVGRLSQDPNTVTVLCDNVKGLGLTLDPSHYICGPHGGADYRQLFKYVYHVHLRDTSKEELQVRVGKGEVEYGRLMSQLRQVKYDRALTVMITSMADVDHMAEMRKMRLLLESLI